MEELEDSIHQVIKSAVKAADFNRVMATVAKANKASETIVKGYEISKALIEAQESLKALMEKVEWQIEELWQSQSWIKGKYQRQWRSHEDIWSGAFGDTPLPELAKMDDSAFRQAVIEYCKSQIAPWEKAAQESPNRLPVPDTIPLPLETISKPTEPTTQIPALYYYCLSESGTIESLRLVGKQRLMLLGKEQGVSGGNFYKHFIAIARKGPDDPLKSERAISGAIKRLREENQEVALEWLRGQNWAKDHLSE